MNERKDGLMTFDYIVSNPPFNMDFPTAVIRWQEKNIRNAFAGVPNILKKQKQMAIYLMFLQHIIHSLDEKGKAAVVVPTGF